MEDLAFALILISGISSVESGSSSSSGSGVSSANSTAVRPHFPVVRVTFDHVSNVFGISLWILLGILAKIGLTFCFLYFFHFIHWL